MTTRRDKHNYYLDIAQTVAERSTCLRRMYGAIIVKDDEIIATGYNGAPRRRRNCTDAGCNRHNIPHGERYELCRAVHAEANCIISAARAEMIDSIMYMAGIDSQSGEILEHCRNCDMCRRFIINAGIERVIIRRTNDDFEICDVSHWVNDDDIIGNL